MYRSFDKSELFLILFFCFLRCFFRPEVECNNSANDYNTHNNRCFKAVSTMQKMCIRDSDLIGSTPRQIWLYELFGFTPPNFIHIPLLCDHDGRRLSKRDEDLDLGLLREKFTPEQVIGALACAAGLTDTAEPVSAKELVKAFSWEKIPKHELYLPNVFRDIEKN